MLKGSIAASFAKNPIRARCRRRRSRAGGVRFIGAVAAVVDAVAEMALVNASLVAAIESAGGANYDGCRRVTGDKADSLKVA